MSSQSIRSRPRPVPGGAAKAGAGPGYGSGSRGMGRKGRGAKGSSAWQDDLFRRLAVSAPAGLVVVDRDGTLRLCNDEATRILGDVERLPDALLAALDRDPAGDGGEPVVLERGLRRLEVECRPVPAPSLSPLRAAWLTDVTRDRRVRRRLAAIARASSSVAAVGNLAATLDAVAAEVVRADEVAAVQVITLDDTGTRIRLLGTAGFRDTSDFIPKLHRCQQLGAELKMLTAAATGKVVTVPHRKPQVLSDPRWAPLHEIMGQPDWDSYVGVPLIVDGRTIGVLNAFCTPREQPPSAEDIAFLVAMAEHAALAVDRAELVSAAEMQARREERHRVAADLHDSVVQQVFSIKMRAEALRLGIEREGGVPPESLGEHVEALAASSQLALDDLRALIHELRPGGLADKGLIGAVAAWVESVGARTGMEVTFRSDLEFLALPPNLEDDVYRIVQEALHNVVKHAEATAVTVQLAVLGVSNDLLVIDIEDNGVGFRRQPQSTGSLGMLSMRERAQRWGGSVVLRSRAGR
ncbi:MAG: GAF domain-containing protein, partial [Micromonosporaceae bacterium]|nr:GAF domain-containing protein [Micromonosporaceae bacterium]